MYLARDEPKLELSNNMFNAVYEKFDTSSLSGKTQNLASGSSV
jgi:hypothetical protein